MVTYRLRAVTMVAAMVVRYMNSIGHRAKAGLRFSDFSHTVTTNRLSAAMSWLEAPNICHRYTQVPVSTSARVSSMEMMVETCMLRTGGMVSPAHSVRVTRMTRNTSWVTVSTIITKAPKPSAVPYTSGMRPNVPAYLAASERSAGNAVQSAAETAALFLSPDQIIFTIGGRSTKPERVAAPYPTVFLLRTVLPGFSHRVRP